MTDADSLFHEVLPLADKIVGGYANIPGMTADDVCAVAHAALHRAALAFDPARGEFECRRPFSFQRRGHSGDPGRDGQA